MKMLENVFQNWTWVRALYLLLGIIVVIDSFFDKFWMGAMLGSYFMVMGIFALGCAGGSCNVPLQKNK